MCYLRKSERDPEHQGRSTTTVTHLNHKWNKDQSACYQ
ncbi:hypothetical protein PgNI_10694 [Pyricularia grisea]|uniref:Uncharacterized protein n=1 Tax=Pyricularia grisea TaxID=148305 RepID=A0A6P8AYL6_PYRGI|nr:hypothetical protein PgNI_10694 [Pyricularia grisea]TLD07366.1 hypothetical protein PgNI_10694 [Pyricularia grisea]